MGVHHHHGAWLDLDGHAVGQLAQHRVSVSGLGAGDDAVDLPLGRGAVGAVVDLGPVHLHALEVLGRERGVRRPVEEDVVAAGGEPDLVLADEDALFRGDEELAALDLLAGIDGGDHPVLDALVRRGRGEQVGGRGAARAAGAAGVAGGRVR